jgi:threonine/homoserine/homoserine lactone efflux protein
MREALIIPVILGIAYAAAPGVVNTECLRRGISTGFRSAFGVQLGALLGDGVWAVIAFSGLAALSRATSLLDVIGLAGGLFLCKIAIDAFRDAAHSRSATDGALETNALRTGLIFGVANPAALAFWSGVGGGVLSTRGSHDLASLVWFLLAFLIGALIWSVAFSSLVSAGRRYARLSVFRVIDAACGAVVGYFGVRLVWSSARRLVRAY